MIVAVDVCDLSDNPGRAAEVLNSILFSKCCEGVWLDSVESVSSMIKDFGHLHTVQRAGFGDSVEECTEDGDAEILGGKTPVKDTVVRGKVRRTTPKNPGRENAVESVWMRVERKKCSPFSPAGFAAPLSSRGAPDHQFQ